MKRELAFALEARSQFVCFVGRTRSSKSPPPQFTRRKSKERSMVDPSENSIDEVHVNRRNKRVKTGIPDGDSMNVDKSNCDEEFAAEVVNGEEELDAAEVSKGEEESNAVEVANSEGEPAAPEVANGEAEPPSPEVVNGEEESATAGVVKDEEEGTKAVEKVYVKRTKRKNQVNSSTPKRFTRSALKDKDENVEELETPTRRKLELKMSKKIGLDRMPTNLRELLETGLLEGFRVFYNFSVEGKNLQGLIKGLGILCSCNMCVGTKVISVSQFEMHACKAYRHAVKYICLENGKSLYELIEVCKASALETLEVALETVISSLPVKGPSLCTNCNSSIEPSSTENLLICDSCLNQKQEQEQNQEEDQNQGQEQEQEKDQNQEQEQEKDQNQEQEQEKEKDQNQEQKQEQEAPTIETHVEVRTPSPVEKAVESNSVPISPDTKRRRGRPRKSDMSVQKSSKSAANHKLSQNKIKAKILKRSSRSASVPKSAMSAIKRFSLQQKSGKMLTMKNQQLHWSVFQKGGLPDGTELTYVSHGKKLLDGYKLGRGIYCFCCKTEVSASQFEAHAGWASRKKPYENIYISNGVSLHEYAVSLQKNRKHSATFNDDLCRICWDGGDLLLCDGCPRSFHQDCAELPSIPRGKWYCKFCLQSLKYVGDSENALVAGRVSGIDPIEQITKRCMRIVKNPENVDNVACVLCRCHDFSKTIFNDRTVIVCDQCEKEYHIGCLREHNMADLKALPKGKWFCCVDCERIHSAISNLLSREPELVSDDLLGLLKEKQKDTTSNNNDKDNNDNGKDNNNNGLEMNEKSEMKLVLLSGKNVSRETRSMLSQTVDIFHECFNPIIDATTGRDFIPSMVYGRKIWSQDFAGMLCAILTIDSNVVSAGTLRVFGEDIAELPIVATSKCNQGKGYFQLLFTWIERLLISLKVKKIVLPAAEEAKAIWTNKFGFQTIEPQQLGDMRLTCSAMMTFKGTSMLQKEISQPQNGVADEGDVLSKHLVE